MNKLYNDTAVQAIANAIRAKNGSSDTYTIAEMSTALNDLSYYAKPTISNVALATFEADGLSLNKLKVAINAVQDLHGYDHPWVGGAGKNKLKVTASSTTINGVTITVESDGTIKCSNNATATVDLYISDGIVFPAGSYILNGCPSGGGNSAYKLDVPNASYATDAGNGVTFTADGTTQYGVRLVIYSGYGNGLTFKPMICLATETDPTFAPYSNICPISGWDNAIVTDTDDVDNPTVTQTTTISLGQTVYGGEVDVVNGVLRITKILYTKTSVSYYGLYGDDNAPLFYFDITDSINGYWDITCESNNKLYSNYYESISSINGAGMKNCEIRTQQATPPTKIYFRDDRFTDETSINAWLASNPLQVLCVLAEPIIIPLTPSLIKSLNGQNNISVDSGDIIELEYFKEV